jgi:hypothetical protein
MSFVRVFTRTPKWRVVIPVSDGRECPDCYAIVRGRDGQAGHEQWHADNDPEDDDDDDGPVVSRYRALGVYIGRPPVPVDADAGVGEID